MQAYRPLASEEAPVWDVAVDPPDAVTDLVPSYELPRQLRGTAVGRALAELPADRAADVLGHLLAVANAVAVADGMSLSDPDSIPDAGAKALRGIEAGLLALSGAREQEPSRVLDTTRPLDLFRVGAGIASGLEPVPLPESELEWGDDGDDEDGEHGGEAAD